MYVASPGRNTHFPYTLEAKCYVAVQLEWHRSLPKQVYHCEKRTWQRFFPSSNRHASTIRSALVLVKNTSSQYLSNCFDLLKTNLNTTSFVLSSTMFTKNTNTIQPPKRSPDPQILPFLPEMKNTAEVYSPLHSDPCEIPQSQRTPALPLPPAGLLAVLILLIFYMAKTTGKN